MPHTLEDFQDYLIMAMDYKDARDALIRLQIKLEAQDANLTVLQRDFDKAVADLASAGNMITELKLTNAEQDKYIALLEKNNEEWLRAESKRKWKWLGAGALIGAALTALVVAAVK